MNIEFGFTKLEDEALRDLQISGRKYQKTDNRRNMMVIGEYLAVAIFIHNTLIMNGLIAA